MAPPKKRPRKKQRRSTKLERIPTGKTQPIERLRHSIAESVGGEGPVLVGPFTGEVGFELLYWIPFVRWVAETFPDLAGRLVVVSRGGVEHWWRSFLDVEYVDILSLFEPHEYVAARGSDKQRDRSRFDEKILERVSKHLGAGDASVLHPSLFFNFYYLARKGNPDVFAHAVQRREGGADGLAARYDPIPKPAVNGALRAALPEEYVAARFYSRPSFPDTPANRAFSDSVLRSTSRELPIVLLNNELELDEHRDFGAADVTTLGHLMTPANNLAIQTAALAGARAFVGTYGGLSYLAPHLGVPAVAFSSEPEQTMSCHLALAQALFGREPWASLTVLRPEELQPLSLVTRGLRAR